jgi:WD40 repeat protein
VIVNSTIVKFMFVLAALVVLPQLAKPVPDRPAPIDAWIEQLGHPIVVKQNKARRSLQRLGEPAIPKLRTAVKSHPAPLVRKVAAEVVASIERGEILSIGTGASYWFNRVAFTHDGQHALVTGGAVIFMDLSEGKEFRRDLELQFARLGLAISHDGKKFATGHQNDLIIRIGDIKTGKVTQTLQGHKGGVHALAFSPEGDRLLSGSLDGTLRLWDLKIGKEVMRFPGVTDQIRSVDFSADGKRVLSGHSGPKSEFRVRLWNCETGKEIQSLKGHAQDVTAVFFLPDGKSAATTGMDGVAILWNLENGKEIRRMTHKGGIYGAALSSDGKRLLTAGFGDKTVRLWELNSGRELKSFGNHGGAALGVAFSRDGHFALSSDARAMIRMWRLPD